MTEIEFKENMTKLQNHFGPKYFPEEFMKQVWRRFEYQPAYQLAQLVTYFICEMRTAPKLSDFKTKQVSSENFPQQGCMACEETPGLIMKPDPIVMTVWRCDCRAGDYYVNLRRMR